MIIMHVSRTHMIMHASRKFYYWMFYYSRLQFIWRQNFTHAMWGTISNHTKTSKGKIYIWLMDQAENISNLLYSVAIDWRCTRNTEPPVVHQKHCTTLYPPSGTVNPPLTLRYPVMNVLRPCAQLCTNNLLFMFYFVNLCV